MMHINDPKFFIGKRPFYELMQINGWPVDCLMPKSWGYSEDVTEPIQLIYHFVAHYPDICVITHTYDDGNRHVLLITTDSEGSVEIVEEYMVVRYGYDREDTDS